MKALLWILAIVCLSSEMAFAKYVDIAHTTIVSVIYSKYQRKALAAVLLDNLISFVQCDVDNVDPQDSIQTYDLYGCERISTDFLFPGQAQADQFNKYFAISFEREFQKVARENHLEALAERGLSAAAWAAVAGALSYFAVHRAVMRGLSPESIAIRSSLGTAITLLGFIYFGYLFYLEENAPIPSLEGRMQKALSNFLNSHPEERKEFPQNDEFYSQYYRAIYKSIVEALKLTNTT